MPPSLLLLPAGLALGAWGGVGGGLAPGSTLQLVGCLHRHQRALHRLMRLIKKELKGEEQDAAWLLWGKAAP